MKRKAEYVPKAFDKVAFDINGRRRLGVVLDYNGVLMIRCMDTKSTEVHPIKPNFGPPVTNIKVVGTVRPHANAYAMVCSYIYQQDRAKNTTDQQWAEWLEKAPNVAFCTYAGDNIVLCEIEMPVTYKYVGEVHTKAVPDDDSTDDLYQVLKRSDGQICIRNPRSKIIVAASPDELYAFFLNNDRHDNDYNIEDCCLLR